jgi:heparin binding hemagglutinin HbhA
VTTKTTTRKIPTPLYAAAGAGDLAYQQLRKLPAQVAQLRARVEELRPAVAGAVSDGNLRGDLEKLRETARRNAATFLATAQQGAQVAQVRAVAVYTDLVARGEKVVSTARTAEVKAELEPAQKAVTAEVSTAEKAAPPAKKTVAKKLAPKADPKM